MADAVTSQTLFDGHRRVVMKFTNVSDGTGEAAVVKVDVSALSPPCASVTLVKAHYWTAGMSVQLLWDATTDVLVFQIPADSENSVDFYEFGGITNNSGTGKTGDLSFTTVGHTAADTYTVLLELVKNY